MADLKISALTASTTPLAGTEVLPIVQSSTTKQVSVANLTAGRNVSLAQLTATATTQKLGAVTMADVTVQIGPDTPITTSSGRILFNTSSTEKNWFINHNWNVAGSLSFAQSTVAGGSTMGSDSHQFLSAGDYKIVTGNVVIGTSGKGIDFSATPGTGTSELLADYEEGTWTPVVTSSIGAITSYTSSGNYTKVGRVVVISGFITITNNGTGLGNGEIAGLPFTVGGQGASGCSRSAAAGGHMVNIQVLTSVTTFTMWKYDNTYPFLTGSELAFSFSYFV